MFLRSVFLIFFSWILIASIHAQKVYIQYSTVDKNSAESLQSIALKNNFPALTDADNYIKSIPFLLQCKGYIGASIDSISKTNDSIYVAIFLGNIYKWDSISYSNEAAELIELLFPQHPIKKNSVYNRKLVENLTNNLLQYGLNNGFPFIEIAWNNIQITNQTVSARLDVKKNYTYFINSIENLGTAKISSTYLQHYLGLYENELFKEKSLFNLNKLLNNHPFLQQTQPYQLHMFTNGCNVKLFLAPKKTNAIDAIVGFLPNNQQTNGSLLLTVDAKIKLNNAFGGAESFLLNWQQIQPASPRLNVWFQKPYLFNSKFIVETNFDLYKRDSVFIQIAAGLATAFQLGTQQQLKVKYQYTQSNQLYVDTNAVKASNSLPTNADYQLQQLILNYTIKKTNSINFPIRGYDALIEFSGNQKKILENNDVLSIKGNGFSGKQLYKQLALNTASFSSIVKLNKYIPIQKTNTLKLGLQSGFYQSASYFNNELFQVGGSKTIRGFDEENIFCNQYGIGTIEYRYMLESTAYFSFFSDVAYTNNPVTNKTYQYISAGMGFMIQTKTGLFNFSIAAGKRNDLPFNFLESKLHFGYTSLF